MDYPQRGISIFVNAPYFEDMIAALKTAVAALREAEIPFLLAGSLAMWARGGPQPYKDLDLMVKPEDAERALRALCDAGMRAERPPEEWLVKAWCGEVMIDLIYCPAGLPMDDEVFARGEVISVMSVSTPVMAAEDVLVTKLSALNEHSLDLAQLLAMARALREQIDWSELEARMSDSPFAKAFFTLVRELGIIPQPATVEPAAHARVRVLEGGG